MKPSRSVARCPGSLGRIAEALAIQQRLKRDDKQDAFVDDEIALLQGQGDIRHWMTSPLQP